MRLAEAAEREMRVKLDMRVDPLIREGVIRLARAENRTVSNMGETLLAEALAARAAAEGDEEDGGAEDEWGKFG